MIYQIKVTQELRIRLAHAENIEIDLSQAPEVQELKASAAEAHLHIEHLHKLIKQYNLTRKITEVVKAWEDSQC